MAYRGDVFHRKFGARTQQIALVVPLAGLVSRGSVVVGVVPSLPPPCVAETVPEHNAGLVRHLSTRTPLERELEERKVEKEKGDELVLAVPSSPVVGTMPAQSVDSTFVGSCANVVSVTDISWHEARWNWYRAQAHSSVLDLSQFQALVVSASFGAPASASMPAALVSQPVQSRFVPGGFQPKMFCLSPF